MSTRTTNNFSSTTGGAACRAAAEPGGGCLTLAFLVTKNRCCRYGRFVGDQFTGRSHDRMSAPEPLFCDRCVMDFEGGAE